MAGLGVDMIHCLLGSVSEACLKIKRFRLANTRDEHAQAELWVFDWATM